MHIRYWTALVGSAITAPLAAQMPTSRSGDYLFATAVEDARALWVNPAGLGVRPLASLFGEVLTQRAIDGGWRVGQYSIALSSRNAGFGYRRDRFENEASVGTWRFGGAFRLTRLALGTSMEFHRGGRSWDIGLQYLPAPTVLFGFVLRNAGRPVVRNDTLRLLGVGSVAWRPGGGALLSAEATATERRPASGYDYLYRAGAQLLLPLRSPVTAFAVFEFPSGVSGPRLARWSLGLAYGGLNQLLGVATTLHPEGAGTQMESWSLAALSRGMTRPNR